MRLPGTCVCSSSDAHRYDRVVNDPEPSLHGESFSCLRCGAFAQQHWVNLKIDARAFNSSQLTTSFPFNDTPAREYIRVRGDTLFLADVAEPGADWQASLCCSCHQFSVWRGHQVVYPPNTSIVPAPHDDMTVAAKSLYNEAAAVLPISRRAAAALARATMEAELREHFDDSKSDLHSLLGKLSEKVSRSLWETLTVLRDTGNRALHGGSEGVVGLLLDESDAELTPFLLSAVNQIVDEVVARPKQANALYNMLPEGVRTSAENKRAKDTRL